MSTPLEPVNCPQFNGHKESKGTHPSQPHPDATKDATGRAENPPSRKSHCNRVRSPVIAGTSCCCRCQRLSKGSKRQHQGSTPKLNQRRFITNFKLQKIATLMRDCDLASGETETNSQQAQ